MTRKSFLAGSAALVTPGLLFARTQRGAPPVPGDAHSIFDVVDHGAKGDGANKDTRAIQRALDAAGKAGGTVYLPAGKYLCGTLHLRSSVTLYLSPGAALLASPDASDFDTYEKLDYQTGSDVETTYFHSALLFGRKCTTSSSKVLALLTETVRSERGQSQLR